MKFIVIGSGLMGVTTAYFLRERGHDVTVIDSEDGPALGASFANGALLTPSMPEPWNAPGSWRVLLASLARADSALQLRLRALPSLAGWGIRFLRNSRREPFELNTVSNLRLALHSLKVMESLRKETKIEYDHTARGTLRLFRDYAGLIRATQAAERLVPEGLSFRALSPAETAQMEPAVSAIAGQLAGALHYPVDETGDAHRFCRALAQEALRRGVEFRFGTKVSSFETRSNWIVAAVTNRGRFVADRYIVAAGSHSAPLLRSLGVHVPVQPAKGYSITLAGVPDERRLSIPIIDDDWHAAVVPLGAAIRVAGTVEFAGYDRTLRPARIQNLISFLQRILPESRFDTIGIKKWCGLRPMSADGVPILGPTPIKNLLINTGHGHLGWTTAAGSAQLLADWIAGATPSIDPRPYALERFT